MVEQAAQVIWFDDLGGSDVALVGGKNASLGDLSHLTPRGVIVPPGFGITSGAYWRFVTANELRETIAGVLEALKAGRITLVEAGQTIRQAFLRGAWPDDTAQAIRDAYGALCRRIGRDDADVAVRSSATAEDLPDASFAGQQEPSLTSAARTLCWMPAGAASLHCSPIGRSATARPRGSST